ncbi:MAG: carbohydrate kinase family protein [Candidatus Methanofastidiosia archaeon]|jgi:hypothetical protein
MKIGVIGFCELDTLVYLKNAQFFGGGALSTAIHAASYGIRVSFYTYCGTDFPTSILCNKLKSINHYLTINNILKECSAVKMLIKKEDHNHMWSILTLGGWKNMRLMDFKNIDNRFCTSYMKLPYTAARKLSTYVGRNIPFVAINPQGVYFFEQLKALEANLLFFSEREICNAAKKKLPTVLQVLPELKKNIVVTLGNCGTLFYSQQEKRYYYVPSIAVDVIDTLGCGDAFAGGVIAFQAKGKKVEDQLAAGILSATLNSQTWGALPDPALIIDYEDIVGDIVSHICVFDNVISLVKNFDTWCQGVPASSKLLKVLKSRNRDYWKYNL